MASESITFDFISRGASALAGDFKRTGDNAASAARGAKVLQDVIASLGQKENRTAAESANLARALKLTGDAEDRAAAKAVAADAAIRRVGDAMADASKKPLIPQVQTAKALKALAGIQVRAGELKARFPEFTVKIDDAAAKAKLALFAAEAKATLATIDRGIAGSGSGGILSKLGGLFGGGAGAASGASGGAPAAAPLLGGLGVPGSIAAVTAGLAALPFAAQAAGAGIVAGLGAGLAGIAILGASKTKSVQGSFAKLKTSATSDLARIGTSFVPVLNSILGTARSVLGKLTPVFAGAAKTISGPFQAFGDALLKAFGSPAVKQAIGAVATSFGAILKAVTPGLAGDIGDIAAGISKIAASITANPQAFAAFIGFLFKAAGAALTAIAWLTKVATYVEQHFGPAMHRVAVIFDGVRHDIAHIWDQIFSNSAGSVIRIAHNVETQFNSLRHGIAVVFAGTRRDIAADWNTIWANTISRVANGISAVVAWFRGLPGKAVRALGAAGSVLYGWGKGVITGLLRGMTSIISSVWNFIKGIPGKILSFLGIKSPPQWAIDAGKHIMNGLGIGLTQAHGKLVKDTAAFSASALAASVGGAGGPASASAAQAQKYAFSRLGAYGWAPAQMNPLIALWNQESGWNRLARNPSSGAYGIPQALPPSKMGAAANPPTSSAAAQINWGLSYIKGRYGSPAGAWGHETAFNWYGSGLDAIFSKPTIIGVGERGPERVQVIPAGHGGAGGGHTYNFNFPHYIGSRTELVRALSDLKRQGRLPR